MYAGHWRNIIQFTQARIRNYWFVALSKKKIRKQKKLGDIIFKLKIFEIMLFVHHFIILCWRAYFPCIKVETAYLHGEESLCLKYKWVSKLTSEECFSACGKAEFLAEYCHSLKACEGWCSKTFPPPFIYSADSANI